MTRATTEHGGFLADLHLDAETLEGLRNQADRFDKNHQGFISEAENAIRLHRDSLAPYKLLSGLRSSSYARRSGPAMALDGVGQWLEKRLFEEPDIPWARLLAELGWLKRFALVASRRPGARGGQPKEGGTSQARQTWGFGEKLLEIRERRSRAAKRPRKPKADDEPAGLPTRVQVSSQDFEDLKNACKVVRDRLKKARKKKKADLTPEEKVSALKDREVGLLVVDEALRQRVGELRMSTTGTDGFIELAEALPNGMPKVFAVLPDGFAGGGSDPVVVPRIELQ